MVYGGAAGWRLAVSACGFGGRCVLGDAAAGRFGRKNRLSCQHVFLFHKKTAQLRHGAESRGLLWLLMIAIKESFRGVFQWGASVSGVSALLLIYLFSERKS